MIADITTTVDLAPLDAMIARFEAITTLQEKYLALIVAEMRRLARVDTGEMRDGIRGVIEGWTMIFTIGEGLPDIRAVANEYGTAKMAAQPMMRPALERYAPGFFAELQVLYSG